MTLGFAWRCGRAAAEFFRGDEFVLGRDTRESGSVLEQAIKAGIESAGKQVFLAGVLPTAAIAVCAVKCKAAAGIMISASHNPWEDNGIKFFASDGFKLGDDDEYQIEQKIVDIQFQYSSEKSKISYNFKYESSAFEFYKKMVLASLPKNFSLKGLSICADLANGGAWKTTPEILRSLGAEVFCMADAPNGRNINLDCGSQHPEHLQEFVRKKRNAIGLAHDGDADRLVMIDENGDALDGDELMAIVAVDHLEENLLAKKTLVATSMSNLGLDECLQERGGEVIRTDVGDRYVLEAMRANDFVIGGEQSGHMIFLNYFTAGDGLLSAAQVLKVMVKKKKPLSELRKIISRYPQLLKSINVVKKKPIQNLPFVKEAIRDAENQLEGKGRILLRYSGTENKIRLLIEAKDGEVLPVIAEKISKALQKEKII